MFVWSLNDNLGDLTELQAEKWTLAFWSWQNGEAEMFGRCREYGYRVLFTWLFSLFLHSIKPKGVLLWYSTTRNWIFVRILSILTVLAPNIFLQLSEQSKRSRERNGAIRLAELKNNAVWQLFAMNQRKKKSCRLPLFWKNLIKTCWKRYNLPLHKVSSSYLLK